MARIDVVMPQMGESIAEGTLSKWLKKIGDPVKRDEPMFEISTASRPKSVVNLITGFIATELVSLKGSPTVSPTTVAA